MSMLKLKRKKKGNISEAKCSNLRPLTNKEKGGIIQYSLCSLLYVWTSPSNINPPLPFTLFLPLYS